MLTCLLLRDFAAAVERRNNPALRDEPLIILSSGRVQRVVAMSKLPRQMGVKTGITARQAGLLCPEAKMIEVHPGAYQRAADELAEMLMRFSDKVEPEYQPTSTAFYLKGLVDPILRQNLADTSLITSIGIGVASSKFPARVAAAYAVEEADTLCVSEGQEAAFLAGYPVGLLPLTKEMERRLPLLGIERIGQLAALPRIAVWEQFGKSGKWIHDLASGIDPRPIQPFEPSETLGTSMLFDDRIEDRAILANTLNRLAKQLVENLKGRASHQIILLITLEDQHLIEADLKPAQPIKELLALARHLDSLLHKQPIQAAVTGIEVRLSGVHEPQLRQLSLFDALEQNKRVDTCLKRWRERHQQTGFYYSELTQEAGAALPEHRFLLYEAQGA